MPENRWRGKLLPPATFLHPHTQHSKRYFRVLLPVTREKSFKINFQNKNLIIITFHAQKKEDKVISTIFSFCLLNLFSLFSNIWL